MSLLFNIPPRFVTAFLPRRQCLLISWLLSPSVILEPKKIKCHCFHLSPSICHEVMGLDAMILDFWMLNFKPAFSFSSFTFITRLFSSSSLSAITEASSAYLRLLIFLPGRLPPCPPPQTGLGLMKGDHGLFLGVLSAWDIGPMKEPRLPPWLWASRS